METTGFRCPACGQTHQLNLDGQLLQMNKEMTMFILNSEPLGEGTKIHIEEGKSLVCPECKAEGTTDEWILAFNEPLAFFDSEHLCHCGGELWMDRIPGTNAYGFVCDKCEWVKPNQRVSGA